MSGGFPNLASICGGVTYNIDGAHIWSPNGVSPSASANTKGSWTQLIASTSADASLIVLHLFSAPNNNCYSFDVGVGGAGSEVIIAADVLVGGATSVYTAPAWAIPCSIPTGTRIAVRCQFATASGSAANVGVTTYDSDFTYQECSAGVDAIGFVSAATTGTTIDPGAVSNTKGSYAQLSASTPRDYYGIIGVCDTLNATTSAGERTVIDIAVGAAASEVIIVPDWFVGTQGSGYAGTELPMSPFLATNIPAGTRVAARAASSNLSSPSRTFGLTLFGFYK